MLKYDLVTGDESGHGYGSMEESNDGRYVEFECLQEIKDEILQECDKGIELNSDGYCQRTGTCFEKIINIINRLA